MDDKGPLRDRTELPGASAAQGRDTSQEAPSGRLELPGPARGAAPAEALRPHLPRTVHLGPKQRGGGTGVSGAPTPRRGSVGGIPQGEQVPCSGTPL